MKWLTKKPKDAEPNSRNVVKRIAWYPMRCTDGYTRWLEYVYKTYKYEKVYSIWKMDYTYRWVLLKAEPKEAYEL